jgi:hypothetical protein
MEDRAVAALRAQAPSSAPSEQESVGALVARLGTDVTRIVRAEIGLLQVRISSALEAARTAGIGLAVGIVLALVGVGIFMLGVVFVVAMVLPLWGAAFAVGAGLVVVAAVLCVVGAKTLTRRVTAVFADEGIRHGE